MSVFSVFCYHLICIFISYFLLCMEQLSLFPSSEWISLPMIVCNGLKFLVGMIKVHWALLFCLSRHIGIWHKGVPLYGFNGHNKCDLLLRLGNAARAPAHWFWQLSEEGMFFKSYITLKRNSARKRKDTLYISHLICSLFPLRSNGMIWRSPQMKTLNPKHSSFPTFFF